eukprot:Hpha_TRINITY_DN30898_c0_g1::TRINITY_DN30898_c0_g1_i1::g.155731::m.155731
MLLAPPKKPPSSPRLAVVPVEEEGELTEADMLLAPPKNEPANDGRDAGDENAWAAFAEQVVPVKDDDNTTKGGLPSPPQPQAHPAALFSRNAPEVTGPPAVVQDGDATANAAPDSDDEMEDAEDAEETGAPDLGEGGVEAALVKGEGDTAFGFEVDEELNLLVVKEGSPAEAAGLAYLIGMRIGYLNGRKVECRAEIKPEEMQGQGVVLGLMKAEPKKPKPDSRMIGGGQLVLSEAHGRDKLGRQVVIRSERRSAIDRSQQYYNQPKVYRPPTPSAKSLPTMVQMFLPVYKAASGARKNVIYADKSATVGPETKKQKEREAKAKALMADPNKPRAIQDGGIGQEVAAAIEGQKKALAITDGSEQGGAPPPSSAPHGKGPGWTPKPPPSMHPDRGLGFDPDRERGTAPGGNTSLGRRRKRRHEDEWSSDSEDRPPPQMEDPSRTGVVVVDRIGGRPVTMTEPPLLQPIGAMGAPVPEGGKKNLAGRRVVRRAPVENAGGISDSDEEDERLRQEDMKKYQWNQRAGSQDSVASVSSSSSSSSSSSHEEPGGGGIP